MNQKQLEMDLKNTVVPSLTLDPVTESAQPQTFAVNDGKVASVALEKSSLSPEEQRMVDNFADQIDITNSNVVLQFGAATQKKIADFSENALQNVRAKDLGEIGGMLTGLVTELKSFHVEEEEKGFLGFFKKTSNKLNAMKAKYDTAQASVDKICTVLEGHQVQLLKDIAMLDKMYDMNLLYFKELSMYIMAGKQKLEQVRSTQLPELMAKASESGLPEDAQAANDLSSMCDRFEKKIHDLELTRMVSIQMAPQVRLVQNNDSMMTEKIQSTLVNTIPLWKSQMVLALGLAHSQQAIQAQREVTDMTNELLRKNADALKMGTIETAKESERGVVDIETLQYTNQSLISTLDEVMQIQEEGRQKRREAEQELGRIEEELKQKLLSLRG
ncbi:MAG: toxic anion resistance protein [Clostridiales bacterium]|nr:toxic anion resistance protein [Clostridiales bacterium]